MKVVLISLERWDDVWRRNQHLATELIRERLVEQVWFVEPMVRGRRGMSFRPVSPGIAAVSPSTPLPRSLGGLAAIGQRIRRHIAHDADLLWVNDPTLGVHCLRPDVPTVYDVTDDWRTAGFPKRIVRRITHAEDRLAEDARTIVCSQVLHDRWRERYRLDPAIVHNGIDADLWRRATPRQLPGAGPHVGYVGTLHEHRLDVDLVVELAECPEVGTLHLLGPNALDERQTTRLLHLPKVVAHGAVPARDVPSWMLAMDVLISPHLINDFTLSLDAIKAYEYAQSGKPVVATSASGFTASRTVDVLPRDEFIAGCVRACRSLSRGGELRLPRAEPSRQITDSSWTARAHQFWENCLPRISLVDVKENTHA